MRGGEGFEDIVVLCVQGHIVIQSCALFIIIGLKKKKLLKPNKIGKLRLKLNIRQQKQEKTNQDVYL